MREDGLSCCEYLKLYCYFPPISNCTKTNNFLLTCQRLSFFLALSTVSVSVSVSSSNVVAGSLLLWYCTITAAQGRDLWCVAKNNADDAALQSALDWCCGAGGADCGPIQNGGPCYDPSDLQRTASFAFNDYYLKRGPSDDACNFGGTAALTSLNPSHTSCKFPSSVSSIGGNYSGPATVGSGSGADLSSSGSVARHWARIWLAVHLLLVARLILTR